MSIDFVGTSPVGRRRHRSWPASLKREIVAASHAPGVSVSMVARRYDVNANQVFAWRKLYRDGCRPSAEPTSPMLVPVRVKEAPGHGSAGPAEGAALIEIALGDVYRVRVGRGFDEHALGRVLDVLERR